MIATEPIAPKPFSEPPGSNEEKMSRPDLPGHYEACIAEVEKMIPCLEALLPVDQKEPAEIVALMKEVVGLARAYATGQCGKEELLARKQRLGELKRESECLVGPAGWIVEAAFQIGIAEPDSKPPVLKDVIDRLKMGVIESLEEYRGEGAYAGPVLE